MSTIDDIKAQIPECSYPDKHKTCSAMTLARLIAALEAVESQCAYWDTLAPGDKYYAARIRYAINESLEQS